MASTVLAKMAVQISANTAELVKATQQGSRSITALSKTVETAGKLMASYFGARAIFSGLEYAVGVLAGFEQKMQEVRAVTGATQSEFIKLQKNAESLGASTEYTATQIAGLQAEFGRLGFSTKEILNSTKATVNLATATGSDLARSAEIAGSTLRAFQLDAKEMGRVTDVMSSSFNKSALQLDSFAESIKYVAPIAQAAGVSLEETTAYLSALADSGIKGSQAGTALRRIFNDLSKDGRPLAERMGELASKGLTLADANDEVGRYAQTALLVLASQNEKVKDLTQTYKEAQGEAKKTADIMRDTLAGDFKLLTSAIDGAIQKGTIFSQLLRTLTQGATSFINDISGANKAINTIESLALSINSGADSFDFYLEILKELKGELGGITVSFADLQKVTEGMGNQASTLQRLKEILTGIGIEITDISNKTLGPDKQGLFGPPPGYEQKVALAKQQEQEVNKVYQERLALLNQIQSVYNSLGLGGVSSGVPLASTGTILPEQKTQSAFSTPFDMDEATKGVQSYVESLREANKETLDLTKNTGAFIQLGTANAISDIAYAFGQAATSSADFGKAILKAVSGFMKSFGEQLIALGVAKAGLDKLFVTGYGAAFAIAAGVALVAASGALNSSGASDVAKLSGGGVSSGGFRGSSTGLQSEQRIIVTGEVKGKDIVFVYDNYKKDSFYRKG